MEAHRANPVCASCHKIMDPLGFSLENFNAIGQWRSLGEDGRPVPLGEVGEFVVSSRHLALGYWQAPDLTAKAFSTDPADPQIRIFRTGDLGRRRADGLFEHVGRKDDQIKLRGRRIEPAEIESALRGFPAVRDAALVVRRTQAGTPRLLVAYVESVAGVSEVAADALMAYLSRHLPNYMLPSKIVCMEKLPRLPNLKIDRMRLAGMEMSRAAEMATRADDPLVHEIITVFERVIDVAGATPEDTLASLGGDSLQAINIALELESRFAVSISAEVFSRSWSIHDLAQWIASTGRKGRRPRDRKGPLPSAAPTPN